MAAKLGSAIDVKKIDREIAKVEKELAKYQDLIKRRNHLIQIKEIAAQLWGRSVRNGSRKGVALPGTRKLTTSDLLYRLLAEKGPSAINEILAGVRERGYVGSGNDDVDKKRLLAALYTKRGDMFNKNADKWEARPIES